MSEEILIRQGAPTLAGIKTLHLTIRDGRVDTVRVDMGAPLIACEQVPCLLGRGVVTRARIEAEGRVFEITHQSRLQSLENQSVSSLCLSIRLRMGD